MIPLGPIAKLTVGLTSALDNGSEEDEEAVGTPSKKKTRPKKESKESEEGEQGADAGEDTVVKDEPENGGTDELA